MSDIEIISQTPITLAELKSKLSKAKSKEESSRVTRVKGYLDDFAPVELSEAKKLKESIEGLGFQRLKDRIIVKIIDMQPKTTDELKILFAGENITLKQDDLAKIVEVIKGK